MKCVLIVKSKAAGEIIRVEDAEAKRLVATQQAKYTNKQAWKDAGRKR